LFFFFVPGQKDELIVMKLHTRIVDYIANSKFIRKQLVIWQ